MARDSSVIVRELERELLSTVIEQQNGSRQFSGRDRARARAIVHPESFRCKAQNANAFARRNRPRVERNDEFACVYLRLR